MPLKFLWIGKYASEEIFQEMALKGYKDPAAQVSQSNIINAFEELGISVDTLNAYTVPSDYQDKYVQSQAWSRTGFSKDISVGFRNIKYISHLLRTRKLKIAAKHWARKQTEESITILVYGMQLSLLAAAIVVKKLVPNSHIFLIVPDLPQYMDMAMSIVKKILKKADWVMIHHQMKFIDGYVLYTKHMAKFLKLADNKWMVMEGSISLKDETCKSISNSMSNRISIMYSGKIDKRYGITELLKAIELLNNEDYEFWFTGTGNAVPEIKERAKVDNRVKYLGFLPSRQALLQKQQEATMLINMRLPTEEGSAYCFPSKIFEYMASSKPVLSFRVDGIPDEYYTYLVEMKSPSAEDISKAIRFVGNLPEEERKKLGNNAKKFVLNNKNALKQTEKILEFIDKQTSHLGSIGRGI